METLSNRVHSPSSSARDDGDLATAKRCPALGFSFVGEHAGGVEIEFLDPLLQYGFVLAWNAP